MKVKEVQRQKEVCRWDREEGCVSFSVQTNEIRVITTQTTAAVACIKALSKAKQKGTTVWELPDLLATTPQQGPLLFRR